MTNTITAYGKTLTETEAHARLAELTAENEAWGVSDDRVTERTAILDALEVLRWKLDDARYAAWASSQVKDARAELALMAIHGERNVPADHRIEYDDNGRRVVRYYTTRDGFLKALVRLYSDRKAYSVIHVD